MNTMKLEPGQDGFIEQTRATWTARQTPEPISMIVIEYCGTADPAFGGDADDRVLGPQGLILNREQRRASEPVEFTTLEAAHEACKGITNRRPETILGIAPRWR
jgi:hypothetical protein